MVKEQIIAMKKLILVFGCFLAILTFGCSKGSKQATGNSSSLFGKWILVEALVDPGDGSGKWTAVKPNYYYLQLNTDSSVASNCFTGLDGAKRFSVVNDSVMNFIFANSQTIRFGYHMDNASLTITGGCIEACGSKFVMTGSR